MAMDLTGDIVFHIACLTGPKGAVCLALSSRLLASLSPLDCRGLTDEYIEAFPCPGPIAAGIVGISSDDLITLKPDSAGACRSGVITHIQDQLFAFYSESGGPEMISWQSIGKVNDEAIPATMPRLEPELVFLMMRWNTRESMTERMLYFLVRRRKVRLTCEVLLRLKPTARLLGRVLLMVWLHNSVLNSVCNDFTYPDTDCCRILVENGATIAEEDAVAVHVRGIFGGRVSESENFIQCKTNCYFQKWCDGCVHMFRQWDLGNRSPTSHDHREGMVDAFLDDWFPVQLDNVNKTYMVPDKQWITYNRESHEWVYVEFYPQQVQNNSKYLTKKYFLWVRGLHVNNKYGINAQKT